jgi:hypothetical protein
MLNVFKNTIGSKGWLKYWSLYLLLMPFYFFKAGNPQVSDVFISFVIGVFLLRGNSLYLMKFKFNKFFLSFIIYATVINFIVAISMMGKYSKGLPWFIIISFYIYNLLVYSFAIRLFYIYGSKFLKTTIYSLVLICILQLGLSYFLNFGGSRDSLFFDNPNQLGYYAISVLTLILLLEKYVSIGKLWVYASILLCTYFTFISVSKAAIGAIILLAMVYLISNNILKVKTLIRVVLLGLVLVVISLFTTLGSGLTDRLQGRLDQSVKPTEISEWEYRGYDRISNHPEYLILGAGEGAYNRFDTYIENHEIHSSFGTLLFCYGIPGLILFILFIKSIVKGVKKATLLYLIPVIAYGVTHMGLRFTMFYIVLAIFPIIALSEKYITTPQA